MDKLPPIGNHVSASLPLHAIDRGEISWLLAQCGRQRADVEKIRNFDAQLPIVREIFALEGRLTALKRLVDGGADPRTVAMLHEKIDQGLKNIGQLLQPHAAEIAGHPADQPPSPLGRLFLPPLKFASWVSPKSRQRIEALLAKTNDRLAAIREVANENEGDISELKISVGMRGPKSDNSFYRQFGELEKAVQKYGARLAARASDPAGVAASLVQSLEKFCLGLGGTPPERKR